ncbi:MAG: tol-pal system protein YbgF [Alphaproteobacteria bacterium]|nr:tol-pal system protein YbgF [Alphaproteobacteria bacterium]MCW5743201.1 tol-pal system protein YbgF [Alphaproteobacteria bacterium]
MSRWLAAGVLALPLMVGVAGPAAAQGSRGQYYDDRLNEMERTITQQTGQIERLQHQIQQLNQAIEKMQADYDFRLQQVESGKGGARPPAARPAASQPPGAEPGAPRNLAPPGPQAGAAPPAGVPLKPPAMGGPETAYNEALDLMGRNDYAGAERALRGFIQRYPQHALIGNAHYWLGETYYARRDFNGAASAFAVSYKSYPRSPKAPDSLLKLGMSLQAQGKPQQACTVYAQLGQLFPNSAEIIKRRVAAERQRSQCG